MDDLLLWATMLVVCGGIGLPVAELVPSRFAWRALLAPTLGCAVLAVVAPVAYRVGLSVRMLLVISAVIAFTVIGLRARRYRRTRIPRPSRLALVVVACWLAATLVMLAPRWMGGDQFAAFQGNQWDTYGYLESAVVYAQKPYGAVHNANSKQLLRNPLYAIAQQQLTERPSVHLLYATFSRVAPGQAYRLYYTFLVYFFSQFVLVALFVIRSVFPRASPVTWIVGSLVFPLGFWGQYVFDINAWSQVASAPLLFAMFGLLLHACTEMELAESKRLAATLAIVVAGAVYLYPEGFIIYVAAFVPLVVVLQVIAMVRARQLALRRFVPLIGMGGVVTAVFYLPVLRFLIRQVTWSSGARVPWWQFFQAFFEGRDGVWGTGFDRTADFTGGLFGLYFATPAADGGVATLQRIAIVVAVTALVIAVGFQLSTRVRAGREHAPETRPLLIGWTAGAVMMLVPAVYLARAANYWPAGKIISFAAPVFVTLLCTPIAHGFAHRVLRPLRWIAVSYAAFQIVSGLVRVPAATWSDGIPYAAPYPAIQTPALKHDLGWDLSGLETILTHQSKVTIHPTNTWAENALMVFLYSRQIPFVKQTPVTASPGGDGELGMMPMPWTPLVELSVDKDAFVLTHADGRVERVGSRGD
jgi:hypothetical protein